MVPDIYWWNWNAPDTVPAGSSYRVLRGMIEALHADGGMSGIACVSEPLSTTAWFDDALADDANYYYEVRLENDCGPGPTGSSSSGAPRPSPICP
jgi:hypothetical protein